MRSKILGLSVGVAVVLAVGSGPSAFAAPAKPAKPATTVPSAEKAFTDGVARMDASDWSGAEKLFRSVLEIEPDVAAAHSNLGYVLRKQGESKHAEALEHYNRALEIDPKLAAALHYRGVLHRLAGREDEAKADHQRLAKLDPALAERLMVVLASGAETADSRDGRVSSW